MVFKRTFRPGSPLAYARLGGTLAIARLRGRLRGCGNDGTAGTRERVAADASDLAAEVTDARRLLAKEDITCRSPHLLIQQGGRTARACSDARPG